MDSHASVGAVIRRGGKILLIDRAIPPFGLAAPAGHVDPGETPEQAVRREVREETGLVVTKLRKLTEASVAWNWCSQGVTGHDWHIYACRAMGKVQVNEESRSAGWYPIKDLPRLKLEPVWAHWFTQLGLLKTGERESQSRKP
ncbi:MAG: NUDIX hydrolase [Candidatus Aenigmarchaeota archaeon]|nr:NUDIX hydrolase [Candidatus Aenigmarchaeota archaeon]